MVQTTTGVLQRLEGVCSSRGLESPAERLSALMAWMGRDLASVEEALKMLPLREHGVGQSARHLLDNGGKRLRPLCVALAARVGSGFSPAASELAVAVELVHNATLLHDDVVDMGTVRRGATASRVLYGNAASIFAGDWLLVEALKRVRKARVADTLDTLLAVIEEMIEAEALQLEGRSVGPQVTLRTSRDVYFSIIKGKTAALFRWGLAAGAAAGHLPSEAVEALQRYGECLGIAFQIVDDTLDLVGDSEETGKTLFADLKEGKMTLPLLLGFERQPGLLAQVEEALSADLDRGRLSEIRAELVRCGAIEAAQRIAKEHTEEARDALMVLEPSEARAALLDVAQVALMRRS